MREISAVNCGRESDVIDFLYGELSDSELREFRSHLRECADCKAQTAKFSNVRESITGWRNETLSGAASASLPAFSRTEREKSSGLAAVRAFFDLSPLWMKGAVSFASLLFFVFAGLAVVSLRDRPVSTVQNNGRSEQEINYLVEQRVRQEIQRIQATAPEPTPTLVATNDMNGVSASGAGNRAKQVASSSIKKKAQRPLSRVEREELAADLRLITSDIENDLDLLADRINQ